MEELERVGLLSGPEVRELIKKRKHFEYKIQKRTKKKVKVNARLYIRIGTLDAFLCM